MTQLKLCGIILCALVICIVFKSIKSEYSLFVRLIITISISTLTLAIVYPILSYIEGISKNTPIYSFLPILFKALGVAFATQITSDACKDAGESSLGERISLFGKAEILVMSLPLIKNLFQLCEKLLN